MRVRTKLKVLALASCAALAAMALALAGCGGGASGGSAGGTAGTPVSMEESYRVISVTEHNGESTLTRGGGEVIALYDGLNLQSGDDVVTGPGADLTMLIDSDKYLYAAENTHFWLEASGKEGSSHTTIHLEEGGVLFRLDTKLNAGESYQVSTPNATMSVRGTSGWVEVTNSFTSRVSLLEGTLTVTSSEPATGEMRQVTVSAGQTATATVNKGTGGGSGQSGMSELQLTVERMTKQDVKLFASSGSTKTSTLEKILEFSADSGKTMNFGSSSITPQEAEKILKDSKQSSTQTGSANISKAVLKTMSTNSASQQQAPAEQESAEQQPAHKHSYTSKVTTEASCTKGGVRTFTCSCGDSYTETISALGHKSVAVPGKDATCTEAGLTEGAKCSVCSKTLTKQKEIAALGHDLVADDAQPATCTAPGKAAGQHCSRCDYTTGGEELAALGHNYVSSGTPATCTEAGYSSSTCTRCGDTSSTTIPALGHSYDKEGTCTRCGETLCEHEFDEGEFVPPTCTEDGYTLFSCAKCDYSYKEPSDVYVKTGHSYHSFTSGVPCEGTGIIEEKCTYCNEVFSSKPYGQAGEHYFDEISKECIWCKTPMPAADTEKPVSDDQTNMVTSQEVALKEEPVPSAEQ